MSHSRVSDVVSLNAFSFFLPLNDHSNLMRTSKNHCALLTKPNHVKQLLQLVSDNNKTLSSSEKNTVIKTILKKNPKLALLSDFLVDQQNRKFFISPFGYAWWSQNWAQYEMLFAYIKTIPNAHQLIKTYFDQQEALINNPLDYVLMPIAQHEANSPSISKFLILDNAFENPNLFATTLNEMVIYFEKDSHKVYTIAVVPANTNPFQTHVMNRHRLTSSIETKIHAQNIQSHLYSLLIDKPMSLGEKIYCTISKDKHPVVFQQIGFLLGLTYLIENKPALIKSYDIRGNMLIQMWAPLNGQWQLSTLSPAEARLFSHLTFPEVGARYCNLLSSDELSSQMQMILRQRLTIHFELDDYISAVANSIDGNDRLESVQTKKDNLPTWIQQYLADSNFDALSPSQQLSNLIGLSKQIATHASHLKMSLDHPKTSFSDLAYKALHSASFYAHSAKNSLSSVIEKGFNCRKQKLG
jgi:hypothetical protein